MMLSAVGNGLMFVFIPARLAADNVAPWVSGAMIAAMAFGGIIGCMGTGYLVRRVGHARTFAAMAAIINLSVMVILVFDQPLAWAISRGVYGMAIAGLFIVAESWLNDACDNAWRGRVISAFYTGYVLAIGLGGFCLKFISLHGIGAPAIALFCTTLAILPVSLTRLPSPPPPAAVHIAVRAVWNISPIGLVGLMTVGGLTLLVQGFAPIYTAASGYGKDDIGLLMLLMQFGMLAIQMPLGALSDRIDRRYVLILATLIVIGAGSVATQVDTAAFVAIVLVFGIWAGATEAIFAVASAHANDRADPQYYVSLTTTLLVAWSISGFILPIIATALTPVFGPQAFMYVAIFTAACFGLFVAYRTAQRPPVPPSDQEPYQQLSGQVPRTAELGPVPEDSESK
jgi:MFS family permease